MPAFDALFVTSLYHAALGTRLNPELEAASLLIAAEDKAGRQWAKTDGYRAIPPMHHSTIYRTAHLRLANWSSCSTGMCWLSQSVRSNYAAASWCWIPSGERDGVRRHPRAHIHPHAAVSGTYYVNAPKGSGAIRFEDPG